MDEAMLGVIQGGISNPDEERRLLIRRQQAFERFQDFQLSRLQSGEVSQDDLLRQFGVNFVAQMYQRAREQFQAREAPMPNRTMDESGPSYFWPDRPVTKMPNAAPPIYTPPTTRFVPKQRAVPKTPQGPAPIPEHPMARKL